MDCCVANDTALSLAMLSSSNIATSEDTPLLAAVLPMTFMVARSCILANVTDEFVTGLPPYSYQKLPFLIKIVGTVCDKSVSAFANSLMSPADDGDAVLTRVTVPLVKMYNKSYSAVLVVAIDETFVDPDKIIVVAVGVIDVADARVSPVNPSIPALFISAFQEFTDT